MCSNISVFEFNFKTHVVSGFAFGLARATEDRGKIISNFKGSYVLFMDGDCKINGKLTKGFMDPLKNF